MGESVPPQIACIRVLSRGQPRAPSESMIGNGKSEPPNFPAA